MGRLSILQHVVGIVREFQNGEEWRRRARTSAS